MAHAMIYMNVEIGNGLIEDACEQAMKLAKTLDLAGVTFQANENNFVIYPDGRGYATHKTRIEKTAEWNILDGLKWVEVRKG